MIHNLEKIKKSVPLLLETGLLFLLLFLKSVRVSTDILRLTQFVLPLAAFTVLLFSALGLIIRLVLRRDHMPVLFVLYAVLSALMLVDSVYCGYTGKLPSIVMLRYAWQLGDVSDAIYENVTFSRLLFAIDIPLWIVYFAHFRKRFHTFCEAAPRSAGRAWASAAALGVLLGTTALISIGFCLFTPFVPQYFENEILSYHVLDIGEALFPKQDVLVLDESLLPGNRIPVHTDAVTVPPTEQTGEAVGTEDTRDAQTAEPTPDTEPSVPVMGEASPYYGIANGRNVITIQIEAFQNFVIGKSYNGQELTPNLNALLQKDTLYFDNYYYQIGGGNTADAEFSVNNSLYAPDTVAAYEAYRGNDYYSMATLLKDNGYGSATAFHGYIASYWYRNLAYPGQGFDAYLSGSDHYAYPKEIAGMGVSDGEFFTSAVDYLAAQKAETGAPFYAFMVTLSSHYAFEIPEQFHSLTLKEEHVGTLFGNYLQCVRYVDDAIGMLIDALKANDLYDNTVITMYGDHFGLPVYDWQSKAFMEAWLSEEYTYAQHFNVPLIIHIPGADMAETFSVTGGHIDVMPTLLHLLGLENEKGIMFGQNLLTATEGIVYQQTHLARGSFISDTVLYQFPFTGIALNATANAIDSWEELEPAPFAEISAAAKKEIEQCMYLLDNNLVLVENYLAALEPGG